MSLSLYREIGRVLARAAATPCFCATCLYTWPCKVLLQRKENIIMKGPVQIWLLTKCRGGHVERVRPASVRVGLATFGSDADFCKRCEDPLLRTSNEPRVTIVRNDNQSFTVNVVRGPSGFISDTITIKDRLAVERWLTAWAQNNLGPSVSSDTAVIEEAA